MIPDAENRQGLRCAPINLQDDLNIGSRPGNLDRIANDILASASTRACGSASLMRNSPAERKLTDLPDACASKLLSAAANSTNSLRFKSSLSAEESPLSRRESVRSCPIRTSILATSRFRTLKHVVRICRIALFQQSHSEIDPGPRETVIHVIRNSRESVASESATQGDPPWSQNLLQEPTAR
jgi:hypothetical protein